MSQGLIQPTLREGVGRTRWRSFRNNPIDSRSPGAEARQCCQGELRVRERHHRGFDLEAAVPADRGLLELLGPLLGEEVEVVERLVQAREATEFADRELSLEQVAPLDGAGKRPCAEPWDVIAEWGRHRHSTPARVREARPDA
jgi:hypothetical protein